MALPPTEKKKETLYKTKVINFFGKKIPIILQDVNGPCTLIAICNVLSLRGDLELSTLIPEVSEEDLVEFVEDRMRKYSGENKEIFTKAYDLYPKLATGIDVNMRFRSITDFEFTAERAIFELLDIPLYHGWLVDPQDRETSEALGLLSYDTLFMELPRLEILENESGTNHEEDTVDTVPATTASLDTVESDSASQIHIVDEPESSGTANERREEELSIRQGELVDNFRKNNLAQLTVYGISCLQNEVKENEPCVFFRNNHFYTLLNHEGELYTLVTDEGYEKQLDLVWEKLNEVDGNSLYMTAEFKEFKLNDHASSSREEPNAMTNTYESDVDWTKLYTAPGFDVVNSDDPSNSSWDLRKILAKLSSKMATFTQEEVNSFMEISNSTSSTAIRKLQENHGHLSDALDAYYSEKCVTLPQAAILAARQNLSRRTGSEAMNMVGDLARAIALSLQDIHAGTSSESQEQSSLMTDEECARYLQKYGKMPDQGN